MLGKLIKHSMKANASRLYPIYIAMGIITVVMLILMLVDWTKWGDNGSGLGLTVKMFAAGALCLTAFICMILTVVVVLVEFRRSMYRREGQLTMTLPVKASSLLFSKWFAGSFWINVSFAAFCLCLGGSFIYLVRHSMGAVSDTSQGESVSSILNELITQLAGAAGIAVPSMNVIRNMAVFYAVGWAIRYCVYVLTAYFAITLSVCRPFNKLRRLGSFIYFFGVTIVVSTVARLLANVLKVYLVVTESAFTFTVSDAELQAAWDRGLGTISITNIYFTVIMAVGLFLLTSVLIDRKVNVNA